MNAAWLAIAAFGGAALLASPSVLAGVPATFPVQGLLSNAEGVPLEGDMAITFRLYASEAATDALYSDPQVLRLDGGRFSAYIGRSSPLDLTLLRALDAIWVGITIGADPELPRIEIASVPFAVVAEYAGTCTSLDGISATELARADHTHSENQKRVSSSCPEGQALRQINEDGSVTCETMPGRLITAIHASNDNIPQQQAAGTFLPLASYVATTNVNIDLHINCHWESGSQSSTNFTIAPSIRTQQGTVTNGAIANLEIPDAQTQAHLSARHIFDVPAGQSSELGVTFILPTPIGGLAPGYCALSAIVFSR